MPIPFILGAAAAVAGVAGAAAGVKGAIDNKEANDVQERAERVIQKAQSSLDTTKNETSGAIEELGRAKLQGSNEQIADFVEAYSAIKNVELKDSMNLEELAKLNFTEGSLTEMRETSLAAKNLLVGGVAGVGAGALLGWGTYGGVMALGTASTGTAIGTLSGVAATNATLAWLGGGAISAGGGGIALGTTVLGGIIAGPALLVAGGIFGAKAKEKLNNAYSNLSEAKVIAEELKTAEVELELISNRANQIQRLIQKLMGKADYVNNQLSVIVSLKTDWKLYTQEEKQIVAVAVKQAQLLKGVIDTPLLTEEGNLTAESESILSIR